MNVANLDETLAEGMDNIQTIYNSLNSQAKEIVKNKYEKNLDENFWDFCRRKADAAR